jgi:cytochrome c biogenesis protein CcdA
VVAVEAGTAAPGIARRRTVAGMALFVLGFSALFASYGAAFGGLGTMLLSHQQILPEVLGGLTILPGLLFAGAFDRLPLAGRMLRSSARPRVELAGAPLLGVMFGLGWTPCIGPTLAAPTGWLRAGGAVRRCRHTSRSGRLSAHSFPSWGHLLCRRSRRTWLHGLCHP